MPESKDNVITGQRMTRIVIQTGNGYWARGADFKEAREIIHHSVPAKTPTMVFIVDNVLPDRQPSVDSYGRFTYYEENHVVRLCMQWGACKQMELLNHE